MLTSPKRWAPAVLSALASPLLYVPGSLNSLTDILRSLSPPFLLSLPYLCWATSLLVPSDLISNITFTRKSLGTQERRGIPLVCSKHTKLILIKH